MERKRLPLFTPVQSRGLEVFSGTPQKDQKLVNAMLEKIGEQIWIVKRPGMLAKGTIGANNLIDLQVLESVVTSGFTGFTQTFTTPGAGSVAVPTNSSLLVIHLWGTGAGGDQSPSGPHYSSGSGGGGGGTKITCLIKAADWGGTINYLIGTHGVHGNPGTAGTSSTVTSAAFTFGTLNLLATSGQPSAGGVPGAGGTGSGGDVNLSGQAGVIVTVPGTAIGGASATLDGINGAGGAPGVNPGGGGNGGQSIGAAGADGADGRVDFIWS